MVVIVKDYQGPRIPETSITTEKQGEENVKYDEKDDLEDKEKVKNECEVEINENDVLEDKEKVGLESGNIEELTDEEENAVKTEDEVEEAVAAAVTGEEEVREAAEREIIQIQVGRRRRMRGTIRGVARRTYIYRTL